MGKKIILLFCCLPFSLLFAQDQLEKADSLYKAGKELYYEGAYEEARIPLQVALSLRQKHLDPSHPKILDSFLRLGKNARRLRQHQQALSYFQEGLERCQSKVEKHRATIPEFYIELGHTHRQMYQPEQAKTYYHSGLALMKEIYGERSTEVGNIYMNFGLIAIKSGEYRDADLYFSKALAIFKFTSDPKSPDFYRIYNNYGLLLRKRGSLDRALEFATKALEIKLLHYDADHPSLAKYHNNIGKILKEQGQFKKALPYMEKTLAMLSKSLPPDHPEIAGAKGELGNLFSDLGQWEKAMEWYYQAVKSFERSVHPTHPYLIGGYFNMGRVHEGQGKFDLALAYYQAVIAKLHQGGYTPPHLLAEAYRQMGRVYTLKNQYDKALEMNQKGVEAISPKGAAIQSDLDYLQLLVQKADIHEQQHRKTKNIQDLEYCLEAILAAIDRIDQIRLGYPSESAREYLAGKAAPIYAQGVRVSFALFELSQQNSYLHTAFQCAEKSRARILWQSLKENHALKTAGIAPSILDSLHRLEAAISDLEEVLFEDNQDSQALEDAQRALFDLKRVYESMITAISYANPRYYALKYASPDISLEELTRKAKRDQSSLLEYFCTDSIIYIFYLSENGLQGYKTETPLDLLERITSLRSDNQAALQASPAIKDAYFQHIFSLYDLLVKPFRSSLNSGQKLVIIPGGVLQYVSFDLLAPQAPVRDFRHLDYLIRHHAIQYAWSAALWQEGGQHDQSSQQKYLGFAPNFGESDIAGLSLSTISPYRNSFGALVHTEKEIIQAAAYFPGRVFTGEEATEWNLIQQASQNQIIHLATHAFANDRYPLESGLLFSSTQDSLEDGFLHAYEIYNLKLDAELAVISACNTGYGPLSEGEGIMNLGRAFTYAGCRSVLTSLWLANDRATSTIINHFYFFLSKGQTKDLALKNAKLAYLDEADALLAHPYFWANLTITGEMGSLKKSISWITYLVFSILACLILAWWLRRKK